MQRGGVASPGIARPTLVVVIPSGCLTREERGDAQVPPAVAVGLQVPACLTSA